MRFDLTRILFTENTTAPTLEFFKHCCISIRLIMSPTTNSIRSSTLHMHSALKRDDLMYYYYTCSNLFVKMYTLNLIHLISFKKYSKCKQQ